MDVQLLASFNAFSDEKLKKHNLFATSHLFLDVYCLKPGQSQKAHAHADSDKIYVVLEGTCRFQVGGKSAEHGPGAAVLAPAGSEHGVENTGTANARLLVTLCPPPSHR